MIEKELKSNEKAVFKSRNFNVGSKLGRQAYKILKTSGSYTQYETDVAVLSAKLLEPIYSTSQQTQEIVNKPLPATGRPTPLAVIADKIIPNRRTMQIVGFQGYVGSKFQSLEAGVPD